MPIMSRMLNLPSPVTLVAALLLGVALTGCGARGVEAEQPVPPATDDPTTAAGTAEGGEPTTGPVETLDATPTPEPTTGGDIVLRVWMPESLAPTAETPGAQVLAEQLRAFDTKYPDYDVEVHVKLTTGPGSAIAYLRSARGVAPGILPDLVLLNLEALALAANDELVEPVNTMLEPDAISEFYPAAVEMGTVDGILIGVPYVLQFQHVVYREILFLQPPNSFERVLESPVPYVFPAGALGNVNRTTLAQYMEAAGGELLNEQGQPFINEDALERLLLFYEQAREDGIIEPALLQLTDPNETWELFNARQAGLAATTSTAYLSIRADLINTQFTWVPTADGDPFALVDGWVWVVTTEDPIRQEAALALLDELLEPANLGAYTEAVGWLPSKPAALEVWAEAEDYAAFADRVLRNAAAVPEPGLQALIGTAVQDALKAVLLDGVPAGQAAAEAARRVNTPVTTPQ
ncbi:MAG TPA: extracellular solute-binding protein [Aggregatilineales bacterium]|nr:extracellular solute-binding protein [Aggregatilineales bacterium]